VRRNLLHSVLITNEVVDEVRHKKISCMIIRVDYEKKRMISKMRLPILYYGKN